MLDRIDIHLNVPAVKIEKLTDTKGAKTESSANIRKRVQKARDIQTKRFKNHSGESEKTKISSNAEMGNKDIKKFCVLSNECVSLLRMAVSKLNMSARSYHRVIKLARTIADLEGSKNINPPHIAEALQYRPRMEEI